MFVRPLSWWWWVKGRECNNSKLQPQQPSRAESLTKLTAAAAAVNTASVLCPSSMIGVPRIHFLGLTPQTLSAQVSSWRRTQESLPFVPWKRECLRCLRTSFSLLSQPPFSGWRPYSSCLLSMIVWSWMVLLFLHESINSETIFLRSSTEWSPINESNKFWYSEPIIVLGMLDDH